MKKKLDKEGVRIQAMEWLEKTVYRDDGRQREIFVHENGRVYFFACPLDFDKDDHPYKFHFLDEFKGYKEEYYPHLKRFAT